MTNISEHKQFVAYKQPWTESERGWGMRPDGYSYHLTLEDRDKFVSNYNKKFNNESVAPDCYSFADGQPKLVTITEELFKKILDTKESFGAWSFE